jgi:hypothetical protein
MARTSIGCAIMQHEISDVVNRALGNVVQVMIVNRALGNVVQVMIVTLIITAPN